jgi:LPXTG-motif cell wall-anchored protein
LLCALAWPAQADHHGDGSVVADGSIECVDIDGLASGHGPHEDLGGQTLETFEDDPGSVDIDLDAATLQANYELVDDTFVPTGLDIVASGDQLVFTALIVRSASESTVHLAPFSFPVSTSDGEPIESFSLCGHDPLTAEVEFVCADGELVAEYVVTALGFPTESTVDIIFPNGDPEPLPMEEQPLSGSFVWPPGHTSEFLLFSLNDPDAEHFEGWAELGELIDCSEDVGTGDEGSDGDEGSEEDEGAKDDEGSKDDKAAADELPDTGAFNNAGVLAGLGVLLLVAGGAVLVARARSVRD